MTGLEPATSWSLTRCATNCATSRGPFFKGTANIGILFRKNKRRATYFSAAPDSSLRLGRCQGFLAGLQGRLEGRGGAEAPDGAADDGEGVQVFLQFFLGEAGIEAGQFGGEKVQAVAYAQRIVIAEEALGPAEEGEAGADFFLHHGGIRGRRLGDKADALAADRADAGVAGGRQDEGMAHAGGLGIGLESISESLHAEDEGGQRCRSPIDEDIRKDAVRTRAEPPFFVWFGQVPVEGVVRIVSVDAAVHPLHARFGKLHTREEEANPFRLGSGIQAAFPKRLPGLFHRHDGNREKVLEVGDDGADGLGAGQVHDDGAETGVLLERKHGKGPVEGVEVPGRNDEGDLGHMQGFNLCKDSENA